MRRIVSFESPVEERLRRDAASALPEPSPELVARVASRLAGTLPKRARSAPRRALRVGFAIALAAAAGGIALFLALRGSAPEPARALATAAPDVSAVRAQLESLLRPNTPPLEAPLLDEARRLAGDGERLGRALLASLPSPLRPAWQPPSAE